MTKKHFELIASTIKDAREFNKNNILSVMAIETLAKVICGKLKLNNHKFNQDMFLKACDIDIVYPCEKCKGIRDCEARICNDCT